MVKILASTPTGAQTQTSSTRASSFFVQRFTPTRRVDSWRQGRKEDKQRKKNRKVIDNYLRRSKQRLSLEDGVCFFTFRKFVISIEVPHENSEECLFSAKVCHLRPTVNRERIMEAALALRQHQYPPCQTKQQDTSDSDASVQPHMETSPRSCRQTHLVVPLALPLSLERVFTLTIPTIGDSATLILSIPIKGLTYEQMIESMKGFIQLAVQVNKTLEAVERLGVPG